MVLQKQLLLFLLLCWLYFLCQEYRWHHQTSHYRHPVRGTMHNYYIMIWLLLLHSALTLTPSFVDDTEFNSVSLFWEPLSSILYSLVMSSWVEFLIFSVRTRDYRPVLRYLENHNPRNSALLLIFMTNDDACTYFSIINKRTRRSMLSMNNIGTTLKLNDKRRVCHHH